MRIEVFTLCYNEEVLMPYFLRHYSTFCDKITVYDNQSTDRTVAICKANPKVKVIPYFSDNQIRDDIYREIKNNCWKESKADWVIVCDADEFLYNVYGDSRLREHTMISPDWWEMISDRLPSTQGQIYEEINQGVNYGQRTKCVMFKPKMIRDIGYRAGAHVARASGEVRVLSTSLISILHYKMLSLEYYINRTALFNSRLSPINKKKGWGIHYAYSQERLTDYYNEVWSKKTSITGNG